MGCWDATQVGKINYGAEVKGKVVVGHSRVLKTSVKDMTTNRSVVLSKLRAAEGETQDAVQEVASLVFDDVIQQIPEEDKADFMESGTIDIPLESGLVLSDEDQKSVYRGVDGLDYIADPFLELYQLNGKLTDLLGTAFDGIEVSKNELTEFITTEKLEMLPEKIELTKAVESILVTNGYEEIEKLTQKFSCTIDIEKYNEITARITKLNDTDGVEQKYANGRYASGERINRGNTPGDLIPSNLPDAAVFVMKSSGYVGDLIRFGIPSRTFSHAGLFSKTAFNKYYDPNNSNLNPLNVRCVQSATKATGTTLQTVAHFGEAMEFGAVYPYMYQAYPAGSPTPAVACSEVERIFRCDSGPRIDYDMPWWEMLWLGDSSHDKSSSHPYCSKLPWTGWKRASNIDIDSKNSDGNLIHPQELWESSFDRYLFNPIYVKIGWWTWSWKRGWKWNTTVVQIGGHWLCTYPSTTVRIYRK